MQEKEMDSPRLLLLGKTKCGEQQMVNKLNIDEVELKLPIPSPKTTIEIVSANDTIKIYL